MRFEFKAGFEKTAFIGAALAGGARLIGAGLGGAARLGARAVGGVARGGANLFARAQTGNLTKPLSTMDKAVGALGAMGVAGDYGDYSKKLRDASMR